MGDITLFHQDYGEIGAVPGNIFTSSDNLPCESDFILSYDGVSGAVICGPSAHGDKGKVFVGGLTPALKTKLEIVMDMDRTHASSHIYIMGFGCYLFVQKMSTNALKISSNSGSEWNDITFAPGEFDTPLTVTLNIDLIAKTYSTEVGGQSTTQPLASESNYPEYPQPVTPILVFTPYTGSLETGLTLSLYSITQTVLESGPVTAIGDPALLPFGIDYRGKAFTQNGISTVIANGGKITFWADVMHLAPEDLAYYQGLLNNEQIELGIHFSAEINTLSFEDARTLIDSEMSTITAAFGQAPVSWCSLSNADSAEHANYIYQVYGATWRNGLDKTNPLTNVGNLQDNVWGWWEPASNGGAVIAAFTHDTDPDPANVYSISYSKFVVFVENYAAVGVRLVPHNEHLMMCMNMADATFDLIKHYEHTLAFIAHTNGFPARVHAALPSTATVYDSTGNEIPSESGVDGNIIFYVEDGETYTVKALPPPLPADRNGIAACIPPIGGGARYGVEESVYNTFTTANVDKGVYLTSAKVKTTNPNADEASLEFINETDSTTLSLERTETEKSLTLDANYAVINESLYIDDEETDTLTVGVKNSTTCNQPATYVDSLSLIPVSGNSVLYPQDLAFISGVKSSQKRKVEVK